MNSEGENSRRQSEAGSWKLEAGSWKLTAGYTTFPSLPRRRTLRLK